MPQVQFRGGGGGGGGVGVWGNWALERRQGRHSQRRGFEECDRRRLNLGLEISGKV